MRRSLVSRLWGPGGARLAIGDAAVLGVIAALLASPLGARPAGGSAGNVVVSVSGMATATLDLAREQAIDVSGPLGSTRIEVRGGRVRVLSSPCARQTCRHGGWIGTAGEMLVCVPNEVVVRLAGGRSGAPDAVTR